MRELNVGNLHQILGGRLRLAARPPLDGEATPVGQIVVDSRQVQPGDVFWGLSGSRYDGATFAEDSYARGALGAIVNRYVQPPAGCWSLEVADSRQALYKLARWNRDRMQGQLVAVTGSVGKTTTRQMIHAVLSTRLRGSASTKNFNNQTGVPLSMLAIEREHDFAVLELAASAPGEIAELSSLCRPRVGVITRIGESHLAGFGSMEGVAQSKTELLASIEEGGWAVLAGDDAHLRRLVPPGRKNVVWFGRSLENDLVATSVESRDGLLSFSVDGTSMTVNAWGRHHLACALAAVAAGRIFGLSDVEIARGLARFEAPPMRCQISKVGGATIIDDSYNASPLAMKAALELLRDFDAPGRRIVVCGDMRELGDAAESLHRGLGDDVVTLCGADLLMACGSHAYDVVAGARAAGMPRDRAVACREPEEIVAHCQSSLQPGDVMLVKGSRAMAMERLVHALHNRDAAGAT